MHTINETIEQLLSYLKWQKRLGIKEIYLSEDIKNMLSFSKKNELLEIVKEELKDCRRCKLYKERNHIVFGEGNEDARLMLIGEAPGHEEDLQGRPFVGAAGHLLDNMLKAINLSRREVYIANIVKCRPPQNRKPERDEIEACKPFLLKQIDIIKPSIICTLGS
ncbi:MAG: uracil-DNA glycosylase, partial [Deltaproteobacteria bacterium]|nr:uracil-DNA glycosylase [Deltaproteobacteria bacterium]